MRKKTPGKPLPKYPEPKDIKRLMSKVKIEPISGCWLYQGYVRKEDGYGEFHLFGKSFKTHRVAYELFVRQLQPGEDVHHLVCRNRSCCNPFHLEALTEAEHEQDTRLHRWMDAQFVGGPWDGTVRGVNPMDPQAEFNIEDREGVHTYQFKDGEYVYAGLRRKKARASFQRVTSAGRFRYRSNRKAERKVASAAEPTLYDSPCDTATNATESLSTTTRATASSAPTADGNPRRSTHIGRKRKGSTCAKRRRKAA